MSKATHKEQTVQESGAPKRGVELVERNMSVCNKQDL